MVAEAGDRGRRLVTMGFTSDFAWPAFGRVTGIGRWALESQAVSAASAAHRDLSKLRIYNVLNLLSPSKTKTRIC